MTTDQNEQSVWRQVQEALYARFIEAWVDQDGKPLMPIQLDNETFDPPDAPWVRLVPQRRPGGAGTIGKPGNRKMDRRGQLFILLREPPGNGVGNLSDLGERACRIFEACRLKPHDIRFGEVEPLGGSGEIEGGRWRGLTIDARFDYEQII
jgi:hypothetical protein